MDDSESDEGSPESAVDAWDSWRIISFGRELGWTDDRRWRLTSRQASSGPSRVIRKNSIAVGAEHAGPLSTADSGASVLDDESLLPEMKSGEGGPYGDLRGSEKPRPEVMIPSDRGEGWPKETRRTAS